MIETYTIDLAYEKKRLAFKFTSRYDFHINLRFDDDIKSIRFSWLDWGELAEWFFGKRDNHFYKGKLSAWDNSEAINLTIEGFSVILNYEDFDRVVRNVSLMGFK